MRPREDDLKLYRQNIIKSWKIMYEVVRNISEECFIQHTSPMEGLTYDCLSLFTRNSDGNLTGRIHMNRNGESALAGNLVEDIWNESETRQEIRQKAESLISNAKLTKIKPGKSDSVSAIVAKSICEWITKNEEKTICVAPRDWPEGCRKLNPEPTDPSVKSWPEQLDQRFIYLGINYVEMLRIDLADGEITSNQYYDNELISEMPVCDECNMPISECESCNGSGYEEPDSPGTYLEPYPCLRCSPWNGDPEDMEYWSDVHQSWISGVGVGCTTEDCPGSRLPTMLEIEISPKYTIEKQTLSKYVQEKLGFYVYALRDPRDMKVFYVGKGVGERVVSHANGMIGNDDPKSMKQLQIKEIHDAGLPVDAWIVQSNLRDDDHGYATESAVYGILKLLAPSLESDLVSLKNIVAPPSFHEFGLIQIKEVVSLFATPADNHRLPHNAIFIKPSETWRRGMTKEELWEVTRGWWEFSPSRITNIKYVISIPNFAIRGIWEIPSGGWRLQNENDRGFSDAEAKRASKKIKKQRFGFDSTNEVSTTRFPDLINKSVEHLFEKRGSKQPNFVYLDDQKVADFKKQGISPFWNINLK